MSESTAQRIADAARAILTAAGTDAVSMRRVATEVGLTPMAIYRHYPNRDSLLQAVADQLFTELGARWAEPAATEVWTALDRYLDFALAEPRLYAFLFLEQRAGARRFPDDFRSGGSPTLNVVARTLTHAGVPAHDVWELALLVAAQLQGLVQLHHGGRLGLSEEDFRALCRRAVRRLIGDPDA